MDGIESIALPPAALRQMAAAASDPIEGTDVKAIQRASDDEKKQLAKDFEAVFLTKLFEDVKNSIEDSGFDDDVAADQVHGMFWSYLAQDVANKGGFGLWQDLYQQFKAMEGADASSGSVNEEL